MYAFVVSLCLRSWRHTFIFPSRLVIQRTVNNYVVHDTMQNILENAPRICSVGVQSNVPGSAVDIARIYQFNCHSEAESGCRATNHFRCELCCAQAAEAGAKTGSLQKCGVLKQI